MPNRFKILIGSVSAIILLDQLTKFIIERNLNYNFVTRSGESFTVIPNLLRITHLRNQGAGLGLFQGQLVFFIIVTIVALGVFIYLAKDIDYKKTFFQALGLTLLIGGTIGNFIDRLFRHDNAVIDWIDVYIFGFNFWVFNIADIALTVGVIAFALDIFILEPERKAKARGELNETSD